MDEAPIADALLQRVVEDVERTSRRRLTICIPDEGHVVELSTLGPPLVRRGESPMNLPRIFLGSSGEQAKLLEAIARGLEDVADVEPWTATFNPGRSTLDRLRELFQGGGFAGVGF